MKTLLNFRNLLCPLLAGALLLTVAVQAQTYSATDAQADACNPLPAYAGQAVYLPEIDLALPGVANAKFVFSPSPGSFVEDPTNGTARLTGFVTNAASGVGFYIDVNFTGRQFPPVNSFQELSANCYVPTGTVDPAAWHTYASFSGTLTGTGGYAGATLTLSPTMHNFQVGVGASGKNVNLGASGWFSWVVSGTPANGHTLANSGVNPFSDFGDFNLSLDACVGQIGDFVWHDANGNGCQDAGELGIAGVKVDLYSGACGGNRTLIATTNTDGSGRYLFSGLCAGDYQVAITTPGGYVATKPNQGCALNGADPASNHTDSKCDCQGASPCFICVTLTPDHLVNLNVDCGYVTPPSANCAVIMAVQNVPITPVTLVGSGGVGGPYTFSAAALPASLGMSAGGTISGTPTVSGTFGYIVTITDAAGNQGTIGCSVTVHPSVTANCVTINAIQGVAITPVTMVGSGGCGGPYTFSATGLPAGLTMSLGGTISGTPTATGTFNYTVTITDACGNRGTVNCSVTVICVAPNATITAPISVVAGSTNNMASVTNAGPGATYLWTIVNGTITSGQGTAIIKWKAGLSGTSVTLGVTITKPGGCSATGSKTITLTNAYATYTIGGWGAVPSGNNIASLLKAKFSTVYPKGLVVGGTYTIKLTSQLAVQNYLPNGTTPGVLKKSYSNPLTTEAGVFGSQVTALKLNIDFSKAGYIRPGLANLKVAPGNKLAGYTVAQVLTLANKVLGGTTSALPSGCTVSDLNNVCMSINGNFDNGTTNNGFLVP